MPAITCSKCGELIDALQANKEAPEFLKAKGRPFEEVWCSGCWLNEALKNAGASETQVLEIGFAHGQRSFFGDPYGWAVTYLNEFETSGAVKDKPGIELADRINAEHIMTV